MVRVLKFTVCSQFVHAFSICTAYTMLRNQARSRPRAGRREIVKQSIRRPPKTGRRMLLLEQPLHKSPYTFCRLFFRLISSPKLEIHKVCLRFLAFIRRKNSSTICTLRLVQRLLAEAVNQNKKRETSTRRHSVGQTSLSLDARMVRPFLPIVNRYFAKKLTAQRRIFCRDRP